jgi:lipopolysaccharide transport system ATP-binding protein
MDAIVIRGITKKFRKSTIKREYTTLKSELVNALLRRRREDPAHHYIEVLKGIDLTIPRGRTVGLIGRNGSGKSTLLKLITGIYAPTAGTISVQGRISALLELGAGFHPDFSGRENILINGIILGMTRSEIRARMPAIIDYSELGDFIDEPVRTYSSGMYMRLAFSVATHVDPDILVIDEILAVGDAHFSRKSMARMNEFKQRGKTIVLVTHDLGTVERWCDVAVWIDAGRVRDAGDPRAVVAHYSRVLAEEEAERAGNGGPASLAPHPKHGPAPELGKRWGSFDLELTSVTVSGREGTPGPIRPEAGLVLEMEFERAGELGPVCFHAAVLREDGLELWRSQLEVAEVPEQGRVRVELDALPLSDGEYRLEVGARRENGEVLDCQRDLHGFSVGGGGAGNSLLRVPHRWTGPGADSPVLTAAWAR